MNSNSATAGDDLLLGDRGPNDIEGGDGNDVIIGGRGRDDLEGDVGLDTVLGGPGADEIDGGAGNEDLAGGRGKDAVDGDAGADRLFGGRGRDDLDGGDGDDEIFGGRGDDVLAGDDGSDTLDGGRGNDVLAGGTGDDRLEGGLGHDVLNGGIGVDATFTGHGRDTVSYDVLETNGIAGDGVRQVTSAGVTDNLEDWSIKSDKFALDAEAFAVDGHVNFFNGTAEHITDGVDVIVLQDTDNDGDPATPFNAGAAATLIANNVEDDGAGFFIYFNSDLQINRLVYSEDLNDATADITVLANINTTEGQDAIDALPTFTASNFEFV